jgi:polysaccharide pyruvyl transferase WcaK-like protein
VRLVEGINNYTFGRRGLNLSMADHMKNIKKKRKKIAFFGPFGVANFGNESTLKAIIYNLRCYQPDAKVTCISPDPEATFATHQIEAIPISEKCAKSWFPLPRNSLLRVIRRVFIGIPCELNRWIKGLIWLRRTDMLIIPGTGLLTDAYGLEGWGPYNIFKWSLIAKVCRCKLLFVSVGAGPVYGALGKYFVKSALSLADFRSYRDNSSVQYLSAIGFRAVNDRVYPDLVFSLPEAVIPHRDTKKSSRTVIGLGLMEHSGKYSTHSPSNDIYPAYLEHLVNATRWLLAQENDVRLLIGDPGDLRVTQEFRNLLGERLSPCNEGYITDEPITSVEELLSQIAATDFVVATRFHNVLLALLCEKPVISISFHHKCESLMNAMGLSAYCLDINALRSDGLIEKFCQLKANAAELKPLIREKVSESRRDLDEQYRLIFNDMWAKPSALLNGVCLAP